MSGRRTSDRVEDGGYVARRKRSIASLCGIVAALGIAACLGSCGGSRADPVVVSVGGTGVARTTVQHWVHVIALGGPTSAALEQLHGSSRAQAVAFLISAHRQVSEARRRRVAPSPQAIDEAVEARKAADGREFKEALRASGEAIADVKLEVESELAANAIRRMLDRRAADVTSRELSAYYRHHLSRFHVGEDRMTELIENLASSAAASALARRIGTGARFSSRAMHESLQFYRVEGDGEKAKVLAAIFAARAGAVSRPMKLNGRWTVFIVRRIVPPKLESFAEVRSKVVALLTAERRRAIGSEYFHAYTRQWTAKTSCRPGYVVQGCAQYRGVRRPERDPFSSG
jgi:foldase protein PrsA